jgi:hypothetical protein
MPSSKTQADLKKKSETTYIIVIPHNLHLRPRHDRQRTQLGRPKALMDLRQAHEIFLHSGGRESPIPYEQKKIVEYMRCKKKSEMVRSVRYGHTICQYGWIHTVALLKMVGLNERAAAARVKKMGGSR